MLESEVFVARMVRRRPATVLLIICVLFAPLAVKAADWVYLVRDRDKLWNSSLECLQSVDRLDKLQAVNGIEGRSASHIFTYSTDSITAWDLIPFIAGVCTAVVTSVIAPNRWWQAFILLLVSVTAALLLLTGATRSVGFFLFDQFSRSLPRSSTDEVVLIVIDEQSIDELGRWPWSRDVHARLIDKLTDANVRAIGINLLFSEPDRTDLSADSQLAAAFQRNGRTVLPLVNEYTKNTDTLRTAQPIPELAKAAFGLGHTGVGLNNGVVRFLFLQSGIGNATWPAFSAAMLSAAGEQLPSPLPGARYKSEQSSGSANWCETMRRLSFFHLATAISPIQLRRRTCRPGCN